MCCGCACALLLLLLLLLLLPLLLLLLLADVVPAVTSRCRDPIPLSPLCLPYYCVRWRARDKRPQLANTRTARPTTRTMMKRAVPNAQNSHAPTIAPHLHPHRGTAGHVTADWRPR